MLTQLVFGLIAIQSTVWKNMAAVHFTTIPCEPNTANRHIESHILCCCCDIRPCTNKIVYARFEVLRTFLLVFVSVLRFFVR